MNENNVENHQPLPTKKRAIRCKQNQSLIPTCRCVAGIILFILFFILIVFNFVLLVVGSILCFVLPNLTPAKILALIDKKNNISGTPQEEIMNKAANKLYPELKAIGLRFFLLSLFTILFIIIVSVAICGSFQIVFFIFILGIVAVGLAYLEMAINIMGYISMHLKNLFKAVLLSDFDKTKCISCGTAGPNQKSPELFELSMQTLISTLSCCGANGADDYYPYNDNKIPPPCCPETNSDRSTTNVCVLKNAYKGCVVAIMTLLESQKSVVFYIKLYIVVSFLLFLVFVIALLETISFYANGYHLM